MGKKSKDGNKPQVGESGTSIPPSDLGASNIATALAVTPQPSVVTDVAQIAPIFENAPSALLPQPVGFQKSKAAKRQREEKPVDGTIFVTPKSLFESPVLEEGSLTGSVEVFASPAPSAHSIGINAMAVSQNENRLVVSREDGSLAVCAVQSFAYRTMAAIMPLVRTGGYEGRTVTRVVYALDDSVIIASYLSGQIAVYDSTTLTVLFVAERFGGAIWDMTTVNPPSEAKASSAQPNVDANGDEIKVEKEANDDSKPVTNEVEIICACADGSWHHFNLVRAARDHKKFSLDLIQVFPKVVGSHRALSVAVCGDVICGGDDCGNVVGWKYPGKGNRGYSQLWVTRLPKGAYAKTICFDSETNNIVLGTSLGDVAFLNIKKGAIASLFNSHSGPITSVISVGRMTVLASGYHDSLRAYRFSATNWIPAEVRRRTHYHEVSQLVHLARSGVVLSASRDGTIMVAGLLDNFKIPPKYCQPVPQLYAYASNASVLLTVAGNRVEFYRANDAMTRWSPLACYTAHGEHGISGVWCDSNLTRVVVATTTRLVILACELKSLTLLDIKKVTDLDFPNTHDVQVESSANIYAVFGMGKLAHISIGAGGGSSASVIVSTIDIPINATSIGIMNDTWKSLVLACSAHRTASLILSRNPDRSIVNPIQHPLSAKTKTPLVRIMGSVNVAARAHGFFDVNETEYAEVPRTLPPETVFFSRLRRGEKTVFMGHCLRGLLFATREKWWMADPDQRKPETDGVPTDYDHIDRSALAASRGPRATCVAAFSADTEAGNRVVVLNRDIEAEVESLPLMWKVRRFGN